MWSLERQRSSSSSKTSSADPQYWRSGCQLTGIRLTVVIKHVLTQSNLNKTLERIYLQWRIYLHFKCKWLNGSCLCVNGRGREKVSSQQMTVAAVSENRCSWEAKLSLSGNSFFDSVLVLCVGDFRLDEGWREQLRGDHLPPRWDIARRFQRSQKRQQNKRSHLII